MQCRNSCKVLHVLGVHWLVTAGDDLLDLSHISLVFSFFLVTVSAMNEVLGGLISKSVIRSASHLVSFLVFVKICYSNWDDLFLLVH